MVAQGPGASGMHRRLNIRGIYREALSWGACHGPVALACPSLCCLGPRGGTKELPLALNVGLIPRVVCGAAGVHVTSQARLGAEGSWLLLQGKGRTPSFCPGEEDLCLFLRS